MLDRKQKRQSRSTFWGKMLGFEKKRKLSEAGLEPESKRARALRKRNKVREKNVTSLFYLHHEKQTFSHIY